MNIATSSATLFLYILGMKDRDQPHTEVDHIRNKETVHKIPREPFVKRVVSALL